MRRVVITGMGIVSCIGNSMTEVVQALQESRSGIKAQPKYKEMGLRSQVAGMVDLGNLLESVDRKHSRFMGNASLYAYLSMQQAIADSGLEEPQISNEKTGIIAGSGGASSGNQVLAADTLRQSGVKRVGPYMVTKTMGNTVSACLATFFGIHGVNYSISSACSTSAHCIGAAYEQIRYGMQDVVFAGGGEEEHWSMSCMFDAMRALSSNYNETPEKASRPYDVKRDGFVISGGGGMLVLEELEHAKARGANIYGELVGYSATSDGADMVSPSGIGAQNAMKKAINSLEQPIDYINSHGTSTPVGDVVELDSIRKVFGSNIPALSSTKSLTGHSLGATGVHEAIFCLLMLKHQFIAGSANIEELDPAAKGCNIQQESVDCSLSQVMSNSFGFGGTNACLVLRRYQ